MKKMKSNLILNFTIERTDFNPFFLKLNVMARNKKRFFKNIDEEFSRLNRKKTLRKKKSKTNIRYYNAENWDEINDNILYYE